MIIFDTFHFAISPYKPGNIPQPVSGFKTKECHSVDGYKKARLP